MLTNTLKHSSCTKVSIHFFKADNQTLELSYSENVKGFEYVADPHHYGIKNMMHRISYLKGDFQKIDSDHEMSYKIKLHFNEK